MSEDHYDCLPQGIYEKDKPLLICKIFNIKLSYFAWNLYKYCFSLSNIL